MRCARCFSEATGYWDHAPCCAYCGAVEAAKVATNPRPLVVGWSPARLGDRYLDDVSGDRLAKAAGLRNRRDLLDRIDTVTILEAPPPAPRAEARYVAAKIADSMVGRRAILVGQEPRLFLGYAILRPFDVITVEENRGDFAVAFLPSPRRASTGRTGLFRGLATAKVIRAFLGLPKPRKCVRCEWPSFPGSLVCSTHLRGA